MESVLDGVMVDRRVCWVHGSTSGGAEVTEANPQRFGGQLPALGSHYVSAAEL
jgi:hypothetical protein